MMIQIKLDQRTFSKTAKKFIVGKVPTARTSKHSFDGNRVIYDAEGKTVATWHRPMLDTPALLVIF